MDFAFSEEQEMLRKQARSLLADRFPPERVAELADSTEGWDRQSWSEIAELGWTGLSVPEEHGGAGMGFLEEAVLFEELGYGLYPGPYFSSVALALPALSGSPEVLQRIAAGTSTATLAWAEPSARSLRDLSEMKTSATADNGGWRLSGVKDLVVDLGACDIAAVVASANGTPGIWLLEPDGDGVTRTSLSTMDTTRRYGRLTLEDAPASLVADPSEAGTLLEAIRRRALAALALEAVGICQRVLELAQEHAKERKQFDKPIGTYQAVSHSVADIYMETELARSLAYWAAWCVAEDEDAALAAATAKAFAGEAATIACERSIQVHGGTGFTWEHILHRFYKRAQWIESFEGPGASHRAQVASALLHV